jgi:ubiquinone/menaquinone biosynthesis C-methylase UbiE
VKPLVESIQQKMSPESYGLDYGCGPGPVASHLLKSVGFQNIFLYDPFFRNNESFLNHQYDFIFCSEVAEHFFDPHKEFCRLKSLLKPDGILFIYSLLFDPLNEPKGFEDWYYRRDPTHVSFYSPKTMSFIAKEFQFKKIKIQKPRLVLLET